MAEPKKNVVDKQTIQAVKFIAEQTKKDTPQIGYELFKRDYLPLLASPPERDKEGDVVPRDLTPWLDICMHPSNPVEVLNGDGTVRFVVPPLVGTIPTYFAAPRGGLVGIAAEAMEKRNQHPVYGERYLDNALAVSLKDQKHVNSEQTKEWNNVLVEHGYPPLPGYPDHRVDSPTANGEGGVSAEPVVPSRVITDDDYEDL